MSNASFVSHEAPAMQFASYLANFGNRCSFIKDSNVQLQKFKQGWLLEFEKETFNPELDQFKCLYTTLGMIQREQISFKSIVWFFHIKSVYLSLCSASAAASQRGDLHCVARPGNHPCQNQILLLYHRNCPGALLHFQVCDFFCLQKSQRKRDHLQGSNSLDCFRSVSHYQIQHLLPEIILCHR